MQGKLERGKAAFHTDSIGSLAILAGASLIAALTLGAPDRALAACGASSHLSGVHTGVGGGVHAATSTVATSGGSGTLGCAGGSSASALRGLPTTSSGRVVETGVHAASRTASSARTATTRTTNASAHLHTVRSPHHA
jgi:hypothetical protein